MIYPPDTSCFNQTETSNSLAQMYNRSRWLCCLRQVRVWYCGYLDTNTTTQYWTIIRTSNSNFSNMSRCTWFSSRLPYKILQLPLTLQPTYWGCVSPQPTGRRWVRAGIRLYDNSGPVYHLALIYPHFKDTITCRNSLVVEA